MQFANSIFNFNISKLQLDDIFKIKTYLTLDDEIQLKLKDCNFYFCHFQFFTLKVTGGQNLKALYYIREAQKVLESYTGYEEIYN